MPQFVSTIPQRQLQHYTTQISFPDSFSVSHNQRVRQEFGHFSYVTFHSLQIKTHFTRSLYARKMPVPLQDSSQLEFIETGEGKLIVSNKELFFRKLRLNLVPKHETWCNYIAFLQTALIARMGNSIVLQYISSTFGTEKD